MPARAKDKSDLPEWIYERAGDDECLFEALSDAFVARGRARRAIAQRGSYAPRTCVEELRKAENLFEAVRVGSVSPHLLAGKATSALRKFVTAWQCARMLESDKSPRYARDRRRSRPSSRR